MQFCARRKDRYEIDGEKVKCDESRVFQKVIIKCHTIERIEHTHGGKNRNFKMREKTLWNYLIILFLLCVGGKNAISNMFCTFSDWKKDELKEVRTNAPVHSMKAKYDIYIHILQLHQLLVWECLW